MQIPVPDRGSCSIQAIFGVVLASLSCNEKREDDATTASSNSQDSSGAATDAGPASSSTVVPTSAGSESSSGGNIMNQSTGVLTDTTGSSSSEADEGSDSSTGGVVFECNVFKQDCPRGEKCVPYASDGFNLDATHCVPLVDLPASAGEPCVVSDVYFDQKDSCDEFSLFWFVNMDGNAGICAPICSAGSRLLPCADADECFGVGQSGLYNLCVPKCDPLDAFCPPGSVCYPTYDQFLCTDVVEPLGQTYGDSCGGLSSCAEGLLCVASEHLPGCEGINCCSVFCDTDQPNLCPDSPMQECVPIYGPENLEWGHVGYCG